MVKPQAWAPHVLPQVFEVRADDVGATTIAGLVSEAAGRIPYSGETVEHCGLQFEVLESTGRVRARPR